MNKAQYESLCRLEQAPRTVSAEDLSDKSPRTLIYGCMLDRETFHLYLTKSQKLVKVVYDSDGILLQKQNGPLELKDCVPSKRVFPERSDQEFCRLLLAAGVSIPFTTFTPDIEPKEYYGKLSSELFSFNPLLLSSTFSTSFEDLGVQAPADFEGYQLTSVTSEVNSIINGQIRGYVRARVLRNEDQDMAGRWLMNITPLLTQGLFPNFSLTAVDSEVSMSRLLAKVQEYAEGVVANARSHLAATAK